MKGIVEVDLTADRYSAEYLRVHPIEGRPFITLDPIDAATTANLSDAIIDRGSSVELDGAVVRISVRNVSVADWNAIDHKAIADAYSRCLHFEREPQYFGAEMSSAEATPQLREFLHAWVAEHAPGLDTENLIARAEGFLALADEELAA